ncbi:MAG: polysaccharide deacetylase family protein [Chitinophagales bacterium]
MLGSGGRGAAASLEEWSVRLQAMLRQDSSLIYRAPTEAPVVALTVDDGPDPRFTPGILRVLERERVPATFFVVGENVARHPDLAQREVRDGFELGNHTFTHPDLETLSPEGLRREITRAEQEIYAVTGRRPQYFRPPRGYLTWVDFQVAKDAGYKVVMWSATVENRHALTVQAMARRTIDQVRPGAIILLHDGRLDRTRTVEALPLIIQGLKDRGYEFVTISQLLAAADPRVDHPTFELKWGAEPRQM